MNRNLKLLALKCLTAAVAVALLAAPTVQAAGANSRPVTRGGPATEPRSVTAGQHVEPKQAQLNGSGKSYFWTDAAITGGVLAGILALGLWGDVAIGGVILGLELLCAGAAIAARKVGAQHTSGPLAVPFQWVRRRNSPARTIFRRLLTAIVNGSDHPCWRSDPASARAAEEKAVMRWRSTSQGGRSR